MRVALVVLAVLLAVVGGGLAGGRLSHPASGHVDAVLDGDTIVVDGTHVRVIGIDTPEIAHDRPAACRLRVGGRATKRSPVRLAGPGTLAACGPGRSV